MQRSLVMDGVVRHRLKRAEVLLTRGGQSSDYGEGPSQESSLLQGLLCKAEALLPPGTLERCFSLWLWQLQEGLIFDAVIFFKFKSVWHWLSPPCLTRVEVRSARVQLQTACHRQSPQRLGLCKERPMPGLIV